MAIKIIETVERIVMTDINDIRSFIEGEIHELTPANEAHLLKLGVAEPAVVVQAPVAPASDVPAAPVAETAPELVSEAPIPGKPMIEAQGEISAEDQIKMDAIMASNTQALADLKQPGTAAVTELDPATKEPAATS